jgi:hypothetical protein
VSLGRLLRIPAYLLPHRVWRPVTIARRPTPPLLPSQTLTYAELQAIEGVPEDGDALTEIINKMLRKVCTISQVSALVQRR